MLAVGDGKLAALYAFAQAANRQVLCLAHVTNTMGQTAQDLRKAKRMVPQPPCKSWKPSKVFARARPDANTPSGALTSAADAAFATFQDAVMRWAGERLSSAARSEQSAKTP